MFENLKLRNRILVGYSIPLIIIILFSGLVYLVANRTVEIFEKLNRSQSAIIETDDMALRMAQMGRYLRGYLIVNKNEYLESFEKEKRRFYEDAKRAELVIDNLEQKERFKKLLQIAENYQQVASEIFRLEKERKHKEAVFITLEGDATKSIAEFDQLSDEFTRKQQEITLKNTGDTKANISYIGFSAVVTVIISLAIAIGAAYLITQSLGTRINGLVKVAEHISEGDLTQSIEVSSKDKDEIGILLAAFRTMTQNLNSLIRQVQQSGIQVTTSATQISASGKQLEATATEQLASTNQVVATAKEIAATSGQLATTMEEVAAMSQGTTAAADGNQKDLVRMEATMSQLADATLAIADKLGIISKKANNINSIVTAIAKVADQTNLLSLNAAIEAEKAGEYGLGFAVVAREIRRLADQTAVATLDIEQMVKEMQSAVATGVMEMDKFTKEVGRGVEDIRDIGFQTARIIEQVQSLTPRFEAVNQGMEAQSQGAGQISEAMIQLSETSSQTANALREINKAIEQLNLAAQDLRQEISRFQVQPN